MGRAWIALVLVAGLLVPGCATHQARVNGYIAGTFATVVGGVWLTAVSQTPTPCEEPPPEAMDPLPCLGAAIEDVRRTFPPAMLTTVGVGILLVTAISSITGGRRRP